MMALADGYQVLARRYRPQQFDDVVGQEHIVRTLKNAITSNRIAHAYLFVGPRGTGKTTTARIFAKALNAEGGPSITPDDDTPTAQAIMNGSCMDVIEIDGASNNSVDQVRDLREDCQYAPAQCTFKVYIIDEVHMLSTAAFNALLKTLEEPPAHVKFIFATTEAQKLLPTIVSRCQRFEFRPIPDKTIVAHLESVAQKEGITADAGALASVGRMADGGMRDALSILDQLISFCGETISEQDVLDVYGLVSNERIGALAQAIAAADYQGLLGLIDTIAAEGRDLYRVLVDLQGYVRAGLLDAIRQGGRSDLLGVNLRTESLMRMLEALHAGETAVQRGLSEKVNFEVALLKAVEASRARAIDAVIKDLTEIAAQAPDAPEGAGQKKKLSADLDLATEPLPTPAPPAPGERTADEPVAAEPALVKAPEPAAAPSSGEPTTLQTSEELGGLPDGPVEPLPPELTHGPGSPVPQAPGPAPAPVAAVEGGSEPPPVVQTQQGAAASEGATLSLEEAVARIPAATREKLERDLLGHFREVRRFGEERS